ncbi:MAG TPA: MATE family efflux transporter, partial [Desulfomicrobiaceae bacterium]|nr:MATE family efflux transporter [Desulfomicrobiaceae bacterium]
MPDSRAAALDFMRAPHKTLFTLSVPVLFSLIAEPVTGLVDTAFVARLGAEPLAALGVGTMLLSAVFWIFNFLGVGTQTEVAQALGRDDRPGAARMGTLALGLGGACGLGLALVAIPLAPWLAKAMGGQGDVALFSEQYIRYRLLGGPAVILTMAAFGVLRGAQDMRTPMWVACGVNLLNIGLDWLLIFGAGPFPAMGVAGAALASSLSQWAGAVAVAVQVVRKTGFDTTLRFRDCRRLLAIG